MLTLYNQGIVAWGRRGGKRDLLSRLKDAVDKQQLKKQ